MTLRPIHAPAMRPVTIAEPTVPPQAGSREPDVQAAVLRPVVGPSTNPDVAHNLRTRTRGKVGSVHPTVAHGQLGSIPASGEAARSLLQTIGIDTSAKLFTAEQIRPAHDYLVEKYRDPHVEELRAEVDYAKSSAYEIRLLSDQGRPCGMVSGWHLGKTGFQIDYLTAIEFPRSGADRSRDVNAGLAILRQIANRHHAKALWVEVDAKMRANYAAAGFSDFAKPDPTDPAGLTMMVLPLDAAMAQRLTREPAAVWQEHVQSWYASNWEDLHSHDAAPARAALARMDAAARHGECLWFQALP